MGVVGEARRAPSGTRRGEARGGWWGGVPPLLCGRGGGGAGVTPPRGGGRRPRSARRIGATARPDVRYEIVDRAIEASILTLLGYNVVTMQARGLIPNHEASASKLFGSELSQRLATTVQRVAGLQATLAQPPPDRPREGRPRGPRSKGRGDVQARRPQGNRQRLAIRQSDLEFTHRCWKNICAHNPERLGDRPPAPLADAPGPR